MSHAVNYDTLAAQAEGLLSGQSHRVANAANLSALLFQELPDVNWVGFYFTENGGLVLGGAFDGARHGGRRRRAAGDVRALRRIRYPDLTSAP